MENVNYAVGKAGKILLGRVLPGFDFIQGNSGRHDGRVY